MSTLTVMAFNDQHGAEDVLAAMGRLQRQELIKIDDAAIVTRDPEGKTKVKQATNLVGAGALGGAFWGMLIGLLFLVPFFGAIVGAAAGAIGGAFADIGIDDNFIKETGEKITPGTSALFLLSHGEVRDRVAEELHHFDFHIISTNLPADQEAELRSAFEHHDQ